MKNKKVLLTTLALLISVTTFSGCKNPGAAGPTGTSVSQTNNKTTAKSTELTNALAGHVDDENVFAGSEELSEESFNTKAVLPGREKAEGEIGITQVGSGKLADRLADAKDKAQEKAAARKVKAAAAAKLAAADGTKLRAELEAAGAITKNADGTVTVDPAKVKEVLQKFKETVKNEVKDAAAKARARIEALAPAVKAKLEKRVGIAKGRVEKAKSLRRKNFVVRSSEVAETTDENGNTVKVITMEFENSRTGVTRENTITKVFSPDKKPLSIEHSLVANANNYSKTASRIVNFNEDGSRTIKITSNTELPSGIKREVVEERTVGADGAATGSGTVTITYKDGTTKTYNLNFSAAVDGTLTTSATDPETEESVEVQEDADGNATATVSAGENEEESAAIDVEAASEGSAESNGAGDSEDGDEDGDEAGEGSEK